MWPVALLVGLALLSRRDASAAPPPVIIGPAQKPSVEEQLARAAAVAGAVVRTGHELVEGLDELFGDA